MTEAAIEADSSQPVALGSDIRTGSSPTAEMGGCTQYEGIRRVVATPQKAIATKGMAAVNAMNGRKSRQQLNR